MGAQIVYTYTIVGGTAEKQGIEDARLDITSPKGKHPPSILGVRGHFLLDALRTSRDKVTVGHPPLFIDTPKGWIGFITYNGLLTWWTDEEGGNRTKGPGPGGKAGPMVVRSPALPAFRRWTVSRHQPLPNVDDEEIEVPGEGIFKPAPKPPVPSFGGYILGPGWMREEVTAAYFLSQANIACQSGWLKRDACDVLSGTSRPLLAAEASGQDEAYLQIVTQARAAVARVATGSTRLVLERTLLALAARAPTKRTPATP